MSKAKKFRNFPVTVRMSQNLGARLEAAANAAEVDLGAFIRLALIKRLDEIGVAKPPSQESQVHAG
jgi:hypothetical protein